MIRATVEASETGLLSRGGGCTTVFADALTKAGRLVELLLFWRSAGRVLTTSRIAERLGVAPRTRGEARVCELRPYLLEPSAIGSATYAIGRLDPPGELRAAARLYSG